MSYIKVVSDTNNVLEECKKKADRINKDLDEKREEKYQKLYDLFLREIEDGNAIKDFISYRMSLGDEYITFFHNCPLRNPWPGTDTNNIMHYPDKDIPLSSQNSAFDKFYGIPVEHAKNIFETQDYGKKILIELLREKFPEPITIRVVQLINHYYIVEIRWVAKKRKERRVNHRECVII